MTHSTPQRVELLQAEAWATEESCARALQPRCGLSLADAHAVARALVHGQYPEVLLPTPASARSLIVELASLGVVARFAEGPDYSPQDRLKSTLASARPWLTRDAFDACLAMSARGEWELALSHCMAHLTDDLHARDAVRALGDLAIEFGLIRVGRGDGP